MIYSYIGIHTVHCAINWTVFFYYSASVKIFSIKIYFLFHPIGLLGSAALPFHVQEIRARSIGSEVKQSETLEN